MYVACRGKGTPTVDARGRPPQHGRRVDPPERPGADPGNGAARASPETTRVCALRPPGHRDRTEDDAAGAIRSGCRARRARWSTDLRALQRVAKIPGPYVFVGSLDGRARSRASTRASIPTTWSGSCSSRRIPETMPRRTCSVSDWNAYDQLLLSRSDRAGATTPTTRPSTSAAASPRCDAPGSEATRQIPMVVITRGQSFGIPGAVGRAPRRRVVRRARTTSPSSAAGDAAPRQRSERTRGRVRGPGDRHRRRGAGHHRGPRRADRHSPGAQNAPSITSMHRLAPRGREHRRDVEAQRAGPRCRDARRASASPACGAGAAW